MTVLAVLVFSLLYYHISKNNAVFGKHNFRVSIYCSGFYKWVVRISSYRKQQGCRRCYSDKATVHRPSVYGRSFRFVVAQIRIHHTRRRLVWLNIQFVIEWLTVCITLSNRSPIVLFNLDSLSSKIALERPVRFVL